MRCWDVDVKDEVCVRKRVLQSYIEEFLNLRSQSVLHIEKEVEVIQISLAQSDELPTSYKASEFDRRVEVDVLAKDEMVGYVFCRWLSR